MGMFDTVFVKKKLPLTKELKALNINWEKVDFQTKDLENLLGTYEITKSGKLRHLLQERKWKDDDSAFLKGYFEVVSEKWVDVPFHGKIYLYTDHCTNVEKHWDWLAEEFQPSFEEIEQIPGDDWWIEFEAIFTKGKLEDIKLASSKKTPIKERLYNNKVYSLKRIEENKKIHKKIINFLRKFKLYRNIINFIRRKENQLHSFLNSILFKL